MKQRNYFFIFITAIFLILSGCASTTPLIKASASGDSSAVQKLINEGANINEQDSAGVTPLMYAVSNGNYKLVKMLIDKGADVKVKDKYGYTAFHYAINYDVNYEITKLLMDVDVNAQDGEGRTPLMNSICKGKIDLVKKLIESGADIRTKDKKGYDALFYAVDYRDIELIKTLIGKGANLETKDLSGITPLVLAASKLPYASSLSKVEMAKRLVKGTDMKAMNPDLAQTVNVIKLLIKSGADINAKNADGENVLDTALSCSQGYIVDELIKAGANLWVPREGKARLFFVGTGLWDYITVTVGNHSKKLNQDNYVGFALIDIESGTQPIGAYAYKDVKEKPTSPVEVMAGQTYYFRVTQDMGSRAFHFALIKLSSIAIAPLTEIEAKQEIKEILNLKEL